MRSLSKIMGLKNLAKAGENDGNLCFPPAKAGGNYRRQFRTQFMNSSGLQT
jgi:hypothetical protein